MVVTRRAADLNPMPTPSRTPSTQGSLRSNQVKAPARSTLSSTVVDASHNGDDATGSISTSDSRDSARASEAASADDSPSPKKSGKHGKFKGRKKLQTKRHRRRSKGCTDFMSRVFLLFFIIYSFSVCPNDNELKSPVCRGLSEYRRLILEPYVFPRVQNAISHPSVAPYVAFVKPHYETVVNTATPIMSRTRKEWNRRVVPQWKQRVMPYWRQFASPYITLVEKQIEPYQGRVMQEYGRYVAPYIVQAERWSQKAKPYVVVAALKTHDGYVMAKPYAYQLGQQLKHLQPLFVRYVLKPLAAQRRQFVDPHVTRMLEKVKELSSRGPKPAIEVDDIFEQEVSVSSTVPIWSSESETMAAEPSVLSTLPPTGDAEQSAASIIELSLSGADFTHSFSDAVPEPTTVEEIPVEMTASPAGTTEGHVESTPEPIQTPSDADEFPIAASDVLFAGIAAEALIPSVIPEASVPIPTSDLFTATAFADEAEETTDIDLDEFYADLGLNDEGEDKAKTESMISPPTPKAGETEEERAERLRLKAIKTAEKRKSVDQRHTAWEEKLQEKVKEQRKVLRKALVALRKQAAAELKSHKEIWDDVEKLHAETEKAVKGSEAYFAKVKNEDRPLNEKVKLWERVLVKVQEKFEERLEIVQQVVGRWYSGVLDEEHQEVSRVADVIKDFAGEAQADLGMDYAWLDDVTYMDWQRYHALMDVHKDFVQQALMIQNGSHPSPPVDPVGTELDNLRSELQDLALGFETRLRRIRREGERAFLSGGADAIEDLDDEMDDTVEHDDSASASVPEVSILPIPDDDSEGLPSYEDSPNDVPPIFVGRSEEEVLNAFERMEELVQVESILASSSNAAPAEENTIYYKPEDEEMVTHEEL